MRTLNRHIWFDKSDAWFLIKLKKKGCLFLDTDFTVVPTADSMNAN